MARISLITGGANGLGRASAHLFADAAYRVAIADLSGAAAQQAAAMLSGQGHSGYAVDITDEAMVTALFDAVESEMGPIAVLQNFAGIMIVPPEGRRASITDLSLADWERTFAVNARGTFLCVREMLRRRKVHPVADARIINISSSAAQLGGYNGSAAYIASKGAILSLTKIAAREAAALGVTVNCIAPGAVETAMLRSAMPAEADAGYCTSVPLGRLGQPADIAAAARYLASPEAGYLTGSCIDVNGGIRMQ